MYQHNSISDMHIKNLDLQSFSPICTIKKRCNSCKSCKSGSQEADPKGSVSFQIMGDVIQLKAWTQERNSNNTKWISHNYYLRAWTN